MSVRSAERLDLRQQIFRLHRFHQIGFCALAHAPHLVGFLALGGAHDDRDMLGRVLLGNHAGRLIAIHAGHHDIHHDQIGQRLLGLRDRLFAAFGHADQIAVLDQQLGQEKALSGRIVHHQNSADRHNLCSLENS